MPNAHVSITSFVDEIQRKKREFFCVLFFMQSCCACIVFNIFFGLFEFKHANVNISYFSLYFYRYCLLLFRTIGLLCIITQTDAWKYRSFYSLLVFPLSKQNAIVFIKWFLRLLCFVLFSLAIPIEFYFL